MRDLSRLFRPKSIAVFGGGFWGPNVVEQCLKMGFDGQVWPVHPTRDEIHGLPCYRTVEELPEAPDASFIGVNRTLTVEIVGRLARRGAGGAVCFASGFKESVGEIEGGADLQTLLLEAAGDMPILGPNCYGLINYLDGALLWPDQHGGKRVDSGVAILTQSSNMLINLTMQQRGLPMAYCAAAGNQAQTELSDMAMAMMDDPRVTAVGLHIEGIGDVRAFEALAAKAREMKKPVVALKVGRSDHGFQSVEGNVPPEMKDGEGSASGTCRRGGRTKDFIVGPDGQHPELAPGKTVPAAEIIGVGLGVQQDPIRQSTGGLIDPGQNPRLETGLRHRCPILNRNR